MKVDLDHHYQGASFSLGNEELPPIIAVLVLATHMLLEQEIKKIRIESQQADVLNNSCGNGHGVVWTVCHRVCITHKGGTTRTDNGEPNGGDSTPSF